MAQFSFASKQDFKEVNLKDPKNIAFWTDKLDVPVHILEKAVQESGNSPEAVKSYIARQKRKGTLR